MKVVYITSSSYSGSTLLSFLLNSHPKVGTIGEYDVMSEIQQIQNYSCSCGQRIGKCNFFVQLKKKLNQKGLAFEVSDMNLMYNIFSNERWNRYFTQKLPLISSTSLEDVRDKLFLTLPSYRRFIRKMHQRNREFIRAVLELQHAEVFVDANKNPYRINRLSEQHEVLPIYLYKNGIAGAYSFYTKNRKSSSRMSFKQACKNWFIEQITINRVLKRVNKGKVLCLSYGDMCSDTQNFINRIYDYSELEHNDISNFITAEHHIVGNAVRVNGIKEVKEKKDWVDNLTQKDKDVYCRIYDKYMPKLLSYNPKIEADIWYL